MQEFRDGRFVLLKTSDVPRDATGIECFRVEPPQTCVMDAYRNDATGDIDFCMYERTLSLECVNWFLSEAKLYLSNFRAGAHQ